VPGGYRIYDQLYGLPYDDELISLAVRTDRNAPLRASRSFWWMPGRRFSGAQQAHDDPSAGHVDLL
jgi:hypothetical protein